MSRSVLKFKYFKNYSILRLTCVNKQPSNFVIQECVQVQLRYLRCHFFRRQPDPPSRSLLRIRIPLSRHLPSMVTVSRITSLVKRNTFEINAKNKDNLKFMRFFPPSSEGGPRPESSLPFS